MSWTSPVANPVVTSHFNLTRLHPIHRVPMPHTGTDYRLTTGTPVRAASSGTVERSAYDPPRAQGGTGAGNHVRINHGGGVTTRYYHLSARHVRVGQRVTVGQAIGLGGSTGDSTGPHLHFEVRVNGVARDPVPWLATRVTTVDNPGGGTGTVPTAPGGTLPDPLTPEDDMPTVQEVVEGILGAKLGRSDVTVAQALQTQIAKDAATNVLTARLGRSDVTVAQALQTEIARSVTAALTPVIAAAAGGAAGAGTGGVTPTEVESLTRRAAEQAIRDVLGSLND